MQGGREVKKFRVLVPVYVTIECDEHDSPRYYARESVEIACQSLAKSLDVKIGAASFTGKAKTGA